MPIIRSTRRRALSSLLLLALLLLPGASRGQAPAPLTQISADPYTTEIGQHHTEVEPDSFAFGDTIVAAFQVGRMAGATGATNIGWASSRDRGQTWEHGVLPGITSAAGGPYERASDPAVAYSAAFDAWLVISIAFPTASREATVALVSRSADAGLTWSEPITATSRGYVDKTWIVCDNWPSSPFYGRCYAQWVGYDSLSFSNDGGQTWAPGGSMSYFGTQLVVRPDGTLIALVPSSPSLFAFSSHDGGLSWGQPVQIGSLRFSYVPIRDFSLPSAEVDGAGRVYVVWPGCSLGAQCSGSDLSISSSDDGVSWSPAQRVPIDAPGSTSVKLLPGLGVDSSSPKAAYLGLAYYSYYRGFGPDCPMLPCLYVGFIASPDGGAHWTTPLQLAGPMQLSWLVSSNLGAMVGDYISTSLIDRYAFPVFAVAGPPDETFRDQAMYTPAGGIDIDSLPLQAPPVYLPLVGTW